MLSISACRVKHQAASRCFAASVLALVKRLEMLVSGSVASNSEKVGASASALSPSCWLGTGCSVGGLVVDSAGAGLVSLASRLIRVGAGSVDGVRAGDATV